MKTQETILSLLASGHEFANAAEEISDPRGAEFAARRAVGYFDAAQALLTAFGELHNELIEHPQFVAARRFARKWQF
jgi:hypothetical protein